MWLKSTQGTRLCKSIELFWFWKRAGGRCLAPAGFVFAWNVFRTVIMPVIVMRIDLKAVANLNSGEKTAPTRGSGWACCRSPIEKAPGRIPGPF